MFFLFVNKLYVCVVFTEDKANKSSNPAKPAPINETSLFFEFLMISIFFKKLERGLTGIPNDCAPGIIVKSIILPVFIDK